MIYKAVEVIWIFLAGGRTNGLTDIGVPRGPRGPKNIAVFVFDCKSILCKEKFYSINFALSQFLNDFPSLMYVCMYAEMLQIFKLVGLGWVGLGWDCNLCVDRFYRAPSLIIKALKITCNFYPKLKRLNP